MTRAIAAGLVYFALVFSAGFFLGTVRALVIAPLTGELAAVLIELPIILLIAWSVCGWVIRISLVEGGLTDRVLMGGTAFLTLIFAEWGLSVILIGETSREFFAEMISMAGLIGLAGQLCFALFPLWRLR